jgi:hypothetical protein
MVGNISNILSHQFYYIPDLLAKSVLSEPHALRPLSISQSDVLRDKACAAFDAAHLVKKYGQKLTMC